MLPGLPLVGGVSLDAEYPLEIRSSIHGRPLLVDKCHYEYSCESKVVQGIGKKTYWICRRRHKGCRVRIATVGDDIMIIRRKGDHTCIPLS